MSGDAGRHDRVRALFLAASRLPKSERDALLAREAGADTTVAAQVRALLAHHDDPDEGFIARPALAAAEALAETPKRIGSYIVRGKIGEGGMGSVFEALQENPRRVVAVKVLHPSVATDSTRRRFEREARLLARLHHPGIAQIIEAGEADTDFGRQPYFVMERVEGLPITEYASQRGLDVAARLQLFARVCDAVQHAHDRDVVHRDLKPANVFVDGTGQPKILDFGIARLLASDDARFTSALTGEDLILGTVPYLAPEQASGRAGAIDGRADVYSLGVVLYELMTGDLPFDVRSRPAAEALRIVLDRDPTPPGTRFRALRGDVETIIGKAMEKEPSRRYATPSALASDVRRHLRSEPIEARPPSAIYRARKFARRNRALVAGGLATIAALEERAARARADWNAYRSGILFAASALASGDVGAARSQLESAPEARRGWEWRYLSRTLDGSVESFDAAERNANVRALEFSEDGKHLYVAACDAGLRVHAVGSGASRALPADSAGAERVVALGRGAATYVGAGDEPGTLALRRPGSGETLSMLGSRPKNVACGAISPRGDRAVSWTDDLYVELFDTSRPEGRSIGRWDHYLHFRAKPAFSSDGSLVALGGSEGDVRIVDADTGRERARFSEPNRAGGLAFSPDGKLLAVGFGPDCVSLNAGVSIYDVDAGALRRRFPFDVGPVCALAFTPDGSRIAIGTNPGTVLVLDAATGERTATHHGAGTFVTALAFSPDATLLAAGSQDGKVSVYPAALDAFGASILSGHTSYVYGCAISPDGKTIASGAWDDTVRLWDAASATEIATLRGHTKYLKSVEFDPSGASLVSLAANMSLRVWDVRTGRQIASAEDRFDLGAATYSADGRLIVVTTSDPKRPAIAMDARTCEIVATAPLEGASFARVDADPRGARLAAVSNDGTVHVLELPTLVLVRSSAPLGRNPMSIAYSRDGERLAIARFGTVHVLDSETLQVELSVPIPGGDTFVAEFSPDGERLAVGCRDGRLRLLDSRTGLIVAELREHRDYVYDLAWSADGTTIVTASGDGTLRIWDTAPAGQRLAARISEERARAAVAPRVRALYAELADADAVAARIGSDPSLDPEARAAALREARRQRP